MATDILFPFYEVFVESIFGGVGVAIFFIGIILAILLMITRTSKIFTIYWMLFYFLTMVTFYFGGIALVLGFAAGFSLFGYQLYRWLYHGV